MTPEELIHFSKKAIGIVVEDKTEPDERKKIAIDFLQSAIDCAHKAILFDTFTGYAEEENE